MAALLAGTSARPVAHAAETAIGYTASTPADSQVRATEAQAAASGLSEQQALDSLEQLRLSPPAQPASKTSQRQLRQQAGPPEALPGSQEVAADAAAVLSAMRSGPLTADASAAVKPEPGLDRHADSSQPPQAGPQAVATAAIKAEIKTEERASRVRQAPRPWWVTKDNPIDLTASGCPSIKPEPCSPAKAAHSKRQRSSVGTPQLVRLNSPSAITWHG